jgi:hypothetical protein
MNFFSTEIKIGTFCIKKKGKLLHGWLLPFMGVKHYASATFSWA